MTEDKSVQQMQATGARLVQSSPGLAEKLVASAQKGGAAPRTAGAGRDDKDAMIADLQRQLEGVNRQLDGERDKNRGLEDQYRHRVASFVKREKTTMNKIDSLEKRLNEGAEVDEHSRRMEVIQNLHGSIVSGLDCIQNNTAKILQDQEKDLMRAFRARLQEVSKDLEAQRSRKGEHSTELQARHRRVVTELHEAQELAQTFHKKNEQLAAENQKLQDKLRTREDDRQALVRELVLSRKEVARLKAQNNSSGKEGASTTAESFASKSPEPRPRSFSQKQIDQTRLQQTQNKQYEREVAYREAATKLKRMVEAERKTVRSLRQQQAEMMQQRTELEVLLKQCLDDVKAEILRHQAAAEGKDIATIGIPDQAAPLSSVNVNDLSAQDRERILELLLSQQRVVQLLYAKTFPQESASPVATQSQHEPLAASSATHKNDDFSWLGDILPPDA
eukprot:TRINITY_DN5847_c0_g1_i3.p1 TRINITY_DN5847_c0_g1~~TRINITY_DN5847_c0_g1_i3.p1  ORF type:complete len:448 (+),score=115.39 TRINITY_DN5847_c0_g1_i3:120-1463(+)